MKLSKAKLHKIGQSGGFLGRLLGPLLKTGLPLIGNVLKPLAKSILIPLTLTAATAGATDAVLHKKMFRSGARASDVASPTILSISNEKMNDFMKIVTSLEVYHFLIKGVKETMKNCFNSIKHVDARYKWMK